MLQNLIHATVINLNRIRMISLTIVSLVIGISSIGVLMLYSAAGGSWDPWALKQGVRLGMGLICMFVVAAVDIRTWMLWAYPFYIFSCLLLFSVKALGFVGMGAQRWLDLYLFNLQPSELVKIALVLALARYFHIHSLKEARRSLYLIIPLGMILIPIILVIKQPDLGTAVLLALTSGAMLCAAGIQWWKFGAAGITVLAAIPLIWQKLRAYQKQRIIIFLNPESDPSNSGYHIIQSKIALGSGGILGKGFMQGSQSQLNFLPEKQTDFMFTMFAEEFGFVGGIILILLYMWLIAYGYIIMLRARTQFGRLLALGMTTTTFVYVFINISMVMGLVPVVGIPLPFMSYGGTALITLLIGQGLIFSAAIHNDIRMNS